MMQKNEYSYESKSKMSNSAKLRKDKARTKVINILDHTGKVIYTSKSNFKTFCVEKGLPFTALKKSYQNNSDKIYTNCADSTKNLANNKKWLMYFGWSAQEVK